MGVISVLKNVSTFQQVESEAEISILWAWKLNSSLMSLKKRKVGQIYLDGSLVVSLKQEGIRVKTIAYGMENWIFSSSRLL